MEIYFICGVFIGAFGVFLFFKFKSLKQANTAMSEGQALFIENQSLRTENKYHIEKLSAQKQEFEKLQTQMVEKFENLANRIFEEKTKTFSNQSITNIRQILDPIKDQMKHFEKRLEDTYSTDRMERGTLKGEINKLIDLNLRMSTEAENLTKALKGDKRTQGFWGELILESVLEKSGLRKDEEYFLQGGGMALRNLENDLLKPDVLIKLPDQKYLIIDSKVSLIAFEQYMNNEESAEKTEGFAKDHVESLKRHIDGLSAKKYHAIGDLGSPEMTLLFIPIEPAFALAVKLNPDLLIYSWDRQIVLVSPTTLLTTLKTIASLWKQDRQNKNTLEIAKSGGMLYEKFCGLVEDLQILGQRIDQTQDSYHSTINKLSQGKGNLIRQVERLKTLGAKTEKSLLDFKMSQTLEE